MAFYVVNWKSNSQKAECEEMVKIAQQAPEFNGVLKATVEGLIVVSIWGGWELRDVLHCISAMDYKLLAKEYEDTLNTKLPYGVYMTNMILSIHEFHNKKMETVIV